MRVGILGSGLMGGKLGTIFARAGHEVVFSYARSRTKLEKLARDAGGTARAGTPAEAEPFALLVGQLAYEGEGGPELAYRFDWLTASRR
jgi:predicted dinucleotide-binding enzyme